VLFRATSRELAREQDVVGYVRNLPDGSVELEAEGPPADVDGYLAAVDQHFTGYIRRTERSDLPARGDEMRFEIRY
jgi:acylphosphatase